MDFVKVGALGEIPEGEICVGHFGLCPGRDVGHAAGDVLDHYRDVLLPLAVRKTIRMDRGSLGVDHQGLQSVTVPAVQHVGEGAIAPKTAHEMQPHEEIRKGVEHP